MTKTPGIAQFASLFKRFRLRSEIETLAEFGDLLAQEGIVYETSLFTRWQKGERVPRDRNVIIAMIRLFIKLGGITTLEESNNILESANLRSLTGDEIRYLNTFLFSQNKSNYTDRRKIFLYASPLSNTFDKYINVIYKEIEKMNYINVNNEVQTHRLRSLMKKIENNEDELLMEYKKIMQGFIEQIKIANICLFEVSFKSLGSGYLIHLALTLSKPTIIL